MARDEGPANGCYFHSKGSASRESQNCTKLMDVHLIDETYELLPHFYAVPAGT
jgi:hypothetical protein